MSVPTLDVPRSAWQRALEAAAPEPIGHVRSVVGLTIDGLAATYRFDGLYTDITAVPAPASVALLLAGLGLVGVVARRREVAVTT